MPRSTHDVVAPGGGFGGYVAAERLGAAGRKVLLAEEAALGGTCLDVRRIPTTVGEAIREAAWELG
jgi:dihydrolipoamide dehydrogenase